MLGERTGLSPALTVRSWFGEKIILYQRFVVCRHACFRTSILDASPPALVL